MATELNNFFASVFSNEDPNNMPSWDYETEVRLERVHITEKKILEKIAKLKERN